MGTAIISDGFARESATLGRLCAGHDVAAQAAEACRSRRIHDLPPLAGPRPAAWVLKWDDDPGGSEK
jgi:hypothetical protein